VLFFFFACVAFSLPPTAYCSLHQEALELQKAFRRGGMSAFEAAKAVMKNICSFFIWPARNALLHEQQRALSFPVHELVAYGKTRFLTLGDAAVRLFE
jgi:hypothetical protein